MKQENIEKIREAVKSTGEFLKIRLIPTPEHPVRNPWAHVWREIKTQMGKSYLECGDADVEHILEIIENCRKV